MKTLERGLGLWGTVAIAISAMIGSGIFVLPGIASAKTGDSLWLAYLIAGLCILPPVYSKSELGTAMPTSGGDYVYLERTFGPLAGTIAGFGLWISLLLKSAFALVGFSAYLDVLAPGLPQRPTALAVLALVIGLNVIGIKAISRLQKIVVLTVLASMIFLATKAVGIVDPHMQSPFFFSKGIGGFASAIAFVYLSFAGVTKVAAIAEEIKDPDRNLPRAMMISLALVTVCYASITFVVTSCIPPEQLATDLHPIYTLAGILGGENLAFAIAILGVVTMSSMAIAGLLASSRFPFAMSRDRLLPSAFHELNARFATPVTSIIATGATMAFAILFLPIDQIAKLTSAFMILLFIGVSGTVIILRETATHWYQPSYKSPLYPYMQVIGIVVGLALLIILGLAGLIATLTVIVLGTIVYYAYGKKQALRVGVVGRMSGSYAIPGELVHFEEFEAGLPERARVVVPLLGTERSAEMLVEMAASLVGNETILVLSLMEVPEHIDLDEYAEDSPQLIALIRRLTAMAKEEGHKLKFVSTVTRDALHSIEHAVNFVKSEWVVVEGSGAVGRGFTIENPIGWLQNHLSCNLAVFKDAGVRTYRELLVHAEPGPHDLLVTGTADRLAALFGARLNFAAISPGDVLDPDQVEYIDQLRAMCRMKTRTLAIKGEDEASAIVRASASYDLLIMGAPPDRSLRGALFGTPKDVITRKAACSVLWLKTPQQSGQKALPAQAGAPFALLDYVTPRAVAAQIEVASQEALWDLLGERFQAAIPEAKTDDIAAKFRERERIHSAHIGSGIALPHIILKEARAFQLSIITLKKPVGHADNGSEGADVVFATVSPEDDRSSRLHFLSTIANLVQDKTLLANIRSTEDSGRLLALIDEKLRCA